jgi:uncharacterized membrane protein
MIRFFTPLRLVLVAALLGTVLVGFVLVPAGSALPIHWNFEGVADAYAPRELALLLPLGFVALVWSIFLTVARFASPADVAAGRYVTGVALSALTGLALVIELIIVAIGMGYPIDMIQALALAFAVLLLVLGNAMPKSQPNSFAGIRMPTTLRDPANWQATHRLGGVLSLAGGIILLLAAFFAPRPHLVLWLIGCIIVPMLIASAYSLLYARRARS